MLIDLNSASLSELELLPGVGPVTAEAIVLSRPFTRLEQLLKVKGIGAKKYATLTGTGPHVCIGSAAGCGANAAVKDDKSSIKEDASRAPAPIGTSARRSAPASVPSSSSRAALVDINSASLQELQLLRDIGPKRAAQIVSLRPFLRKDDLLKVKGIGSITYHKLEPHFTIGRNTFNDTSNRVDVSTRAYEQDPLEHGHAAERDSESDPLELPTIHESRRAPHVCREVDTSVRANLFSDRYRPVLGSGSENTTAKNAILVASWNIRNLSKKKDVALLHRIKDIIEEFDIVALQEVRDTMVLKMLKSLLSGWDFVVSAAVGRDAPASPSPSEAGTSTRSEHFAFLFRRSVVRVASKSSLGAGFDKRFDRPPFIVHFVLSTAKQSAPPLELTLVNVHVSCGEKQGRVAEVQEIKRLKRAIQEQQLRENGEKRTVLVLGDFNLAPHEFGNNNNYNFLDRATMMPLVCAPLSSTVSGKLCDNICMDLVDITALQQHQSCQIESGVYRFDWRYYPHSKPGFATSMQHSRQLLRRRAPSSMAAEDDEDGATLLPRQRAQEARMRCTYEISDHCPVWVAFAPTH